MKIAFVHAGNKFSAGLLEELKSKLKTHQVVAWNIEKKAPAADFEVALVMGKFSREQMADQPKLRLIQTLSAGYELIDVVAASELGIWVAYAPSELTGNAVSVAEFAMLLLLGASRQLNSVIRRPWKNASKSVVTSTALYGKTVCIVGLGAIGKLLAERLLPFGMKINGTEDHPKEIPAGVTVFKSKELAKAAADADYVVLCVRAAKDNEHLVNAKMLKGMKQGAILVNVARGSLVDEGALLAAVKSGHIAAAGLDVVANEPVAPDDPLLNLAQLLITPHVAGTTDITLSGTAVYATGVVEDFAKGKKPAAVINKPESPRQTL